jgi:hypothetical protein
VVIAAAASRRLGLETGSRLRFGAEPDQTGIGSRGSRTLFLDEKPAFELSYWCGTCPFLFQRQAGANTTVSLDELEQRLADGLDDLASDVIERFAELLPAGEYAAVLLRIEPRLVVPGNEDDYFSAEQLATWGIDPFWGLPHYSRTPYYRTFQTALDEAAHVYEFVVPMVPPRWNDPVRVREHAVRLESSERPTGVAVSTLDVCAPALAEGEDWYEHWGLTHFLLDGHHKLEAAARAGRPLRLLSLLSLDASLAQPDDVAAAIEVRGREPSVRRAPSQELVKQVFDARRFPPQALPSSAEPSEA